MTKLNKRFLSALLAVILLLTNFPVVSAASDSFAIYYEGETVTEVEFYEHERIAVSAEGIPGGTYQWQIQIPGTEQWVNIQGQTSQTINLSKAVVGSLMMNGSAYVRCAAISDGEEIDHTVALRTTVKKEEPAPQISAPPVVTAPAAKPTPAPTEPPVEVTEAPTEPIVETVPVPEIAEPTESVEVPAESIEQTEPDAQLEVTAPAEEPVVEDTDAPVEKAETPVEVEEIPVETAAPTELESEVVATAPAEEPAVEATEAPVEKAETPVEVEEIPVETTAPAKPESEVVATAPAEEPVVEDTDAPVEKAETPVEVEEIPAETTAPAKPEAEVVATAPAEEPVVEATGAPAVTEAPAEIPTEPAEEKPAETFIEKVVQMLAPKANADEGSDTEIVTITIHYRAVDREGKFEKTQEDAGSIENAANAEPVVDPYVANIISGSNLNVTVPCRVIPGYTLVVPSYHENTEIAVSGNNLELNLSGVSKDMAFYVYYKEVMVSYSARYFKQNVYNDLYTEDPNVLTENIKQNMKGYPGDEPDTTVIYPDITGFTALFFQPDTIASDGSTIFEVYYDRNYYLMNFNMDGGYGTAPVYARYGTAFTVANPTKSGWNFAGWELEKVNGIDATDSQKQQTFPSTIPTENRTYIAKWTQGSTKLTVVYWLEDANTDKYNFYASKLYENVNTGLPVSALDYVPVDIATVFGDDSPYIAFNESKTKEEEAKQEYLDSGKVIVQGDGSTILNVYFDRKDYFIKFYYARSNNSGYQVATSTNDWSKYGNLTTGNGWTNAGGEPVIADKFKNMVGSELIDGYTYHYILLKAKYGANLLALWPAAPVTNNYQSGAANSLNYKMVSWGVEYESPYYEDYKNKNLNIKGPYAQMDSLMIYDNVYHPEHDAYEAQSMLAYWNAGPHEWRYNVYIALYDGEITDKETVNSSISGTEMEYYLYDYYSVYSNQADVGSQNEIAIEGFVFQGKEKVGNTYVANFYYCRAIRKLYYRNFNENMGDGNGAAVPFGKPLTNYGSYFSKADMEENHYPTDLEPNAYYFDGWYTTPEHLAGTEMDWNSTMPNADLTVYAKWDPVSYDTYFYMDYARYEAGIEFFKTEDTPHGSNITADLSTIRNLKFKDANGTINDEYLFVNWFYIDTDGTKKAFNPSEMAIRKELHLFAEWTSTAVKEYTVSYQLGKELENGEIIAADSEVFLADKSTGYALEATTKTFTALPKDKLTNFPDGTKDQLWLPHTNSHSIVMRSDNSENVFTFYYVTKDAVKYTVRYLDSATNEPVSAEEEHTVGVAVVTERFKYVEDYIPDAFHKRLVLSTDEAENVIIFYYTKDDDIDAGGTGSGGSGGGGDDGDEPGEGRARYLVVHHFPELDGSDYLIEEDSIGDIGERTTVTEQERPGFEFDVEKTKTEYNERFDGNTAEQNVTQSTVNGKWNVSGTITSGKDDDTNKPLELHLYYKRVAYGYKVIHKDRESNEVLETVEMDPVPFETAVSVKSEGIAGYDLYAADEDGTKTLTLKIGWEEDLNVITFYYIKKKVKIEYVPVCTDTALTSGFGGVSQPVELDKTQISISGSEASAASGFNFLGWYKDKNPTDENRITQHTYIGSSDIVLTSDVYDYTYYAIFEPITLTISQTNMKPSDSAVYEVVQGDDVIARVMLTGESDSVTLQAIPAGNYTVREVTSNWTWTYTDTQTASVTVVAGQTNTVTFDYEEKYEGSCWLHSENHSENHR